MNRLRNRLVLAFLAATLAPLALLTWLTASLLDQSLALRSTGEVNELSQALEETGREFYRQARERLRESAESGRLEPERFAAAGRTGWPPRITAFWESGESERFLLAGNEGDLLHYLVRRDDGVLEYTLSLGAVRMNRLSALYTRSRALVAGAEERDFGRGFRYTLLVVGAAVAATAVAVTVLFAHRISRPIHRLTGALQRLADGESGVRVDAGRSDEIGAALAAFNEMAAQLEQSRERLIMLTRLSSWQAIGRKMAHEVKNSLTPIRLTVEEMAARHVARLSPENRAFFEQAARIIIDEVTRLERQVRAFSDLAAEPPVRRSALDLNRIVEERVEFLRSAFPVVTFEVRLSPENPRAYADEDLVHGILTNLLENAAEACGDGGVVLVTTEVSDGEVRVEVHDSGPGLSAQASDTLFQPTISSKPAGMGLGLSIAHKSAMLSGGDIASVSGELQGAGFRLSLPRDGREARKRESEWAQSES